MHQQSTYFMPVLITLLNTVHESAVWTINSDNPSIKQVVRADFQCHLLGTKNIQNVSEYTMVLAFFYFMSVPITPYSYCCFANRL
jgi:hypothetical protein